ncbi:hypothetical protein SS1G_12724 [Sclerotinia sclerotiorum 1980 UF-70]|uniref:AB hydrolase-1 domain-containing protein n=2 Tax=Sclerotinia sclerotiorum (strain ATCC 18683 / 1980 / Ss-1) TaxID=665079 RepID=A7F549_SCLS1|nr:hypothetical protein SS1G_12724 [Sclerotinia sclerotiorum 1980 UF-70]APA06566.1 hypothetical protein sscle_02g013360 [Sclerotinia sclerotiorum 1980 UF-70]EDN97870.1 hypothetical protein SS1G_12724 [Sclerotinia sclerotiorum 1980 UF-70]
MVAVTMKSAVAAVVALGASIANAQLDAEAYASAPVNLTLLPQPIAISTYTGDGIVGALHRPLNTSDPKASIAIMVMHAEQDYWAFYPCTQLTARGYTVLCSNNAASKTSLMNDLDFPSMMTNVGEMVKWLRNQTYIEKVVLFGHSGGGAMISEYQNIAENGVSACNGPEKISPCSDDVAGLPSADGVILHDANYGLSTMGFMSLNAAIKNETTGLRDIDATLDLYNTTYGYNASGGSSNYTTDFLSRWYTAAAARNNRLLTFAQSRANAINNYNTSDALFDDDEGFIIPDSNYLGMNNKVIAEDTSLLSHTTYAHPLILNNGTVSTQIINTVRVASGSDGASSFYGGALKTTIGRYLRTFAIKVGVDYKINEDGIDGVQWNSSHMVPINAIKGVKVPLLLMGNTGHYEYLNAEKIFLASVSNDTSIAFVEGAQHGINPCTECETYPGQYNNTIKNAFDYQAAWLEKAGRFI